VTITTLDSAGIVGQYTSIAIGADGLPIVSYYDVTNGRLRTAKCSNAACTASVNRTVDAAADVGQYTSIAIGTDGFPVIAYHDVTNRDLKVAKCLNAVCTAGVTITTVDSAGDVGRYASLAIGTDGFPVIGYYDSTNSDLKVAKCVNAACTGSSTITIVDSTGSVGFYASMAIGTDGLPVISYVQGTVTNATVRAAKCANAACTGSATISPVASFDSSVDIVGTSIAIGAEGFPVISFGDLGSGLRVAKCTNTACLRP
jgi:predicted regulator of Ras-like GTPase activity (Roadblock/LC7/MglB family)